MIFNELFNENNMEVLEWVVSKILNIDIKKVKGKVVVKNSKIPKQHIKEKQKYVDLLVEVGKKQILIELNNNYNGNYLRNLLYVFEILLGGYTVGKYSSYKNAKGILLVNLNWYNRKSLYRRIKSKVEVEYGYHERHTTEKIIEIYNVNLAKYENVSYNDIKNEDKFYKILTIKDKEELECVRKEEKILENYIDKLSHLSENVLYREDYMSIEVSNYIEKCIKEQEKEEARESGAHKREREMILKLNQMGLSKEDIAKASSLSVPEVVKILQKN